MEKTKVNRMQKPRQYFWRILGQKQPQEHLRVCGGNRNIQYSQVPFSNRLKVALQLHRQCLKRNCVI